MTETPTTSRDAEISQGLLQLIRISGENSKAHGFHDDWPQPRVQPFPAEIEEYRTALRRAIAEKLALVHEEVSEMLGEIRSGRDPLEIYFVHKLTGHHFSEQQYDADGVPLCKPEGFLVEAADAIIRLSDLTFLVDGEEQLVEAVHAKIEYNVTRPYKHGRKF